MNYLLPLLLFFVQGAQYKVQKTYAIIYKGDKAGELKCSRWQDGSTTVFENHSKVSIKMLATLEVKYYQKAVFDNHGLSEAKYTLWVNDKVHKNSVIKRAGNGYRATIDGNEQSISSPIRYTSSCLMLMEPNNISVVFSEQFAQFHKMVVLAPNKFKKLANDGKENIYHYNSEGILRHASLDGGLMSFELKLQD